MTPQSSEAKVRRVWGFWATIGLGLAVGLARIAAQVVVLVPIVMVTVIADSQGDAVSSAQSLGSFGLLLSVAGLVSCAVGVSAILVLILARRGASIDDYLALRPVRRLDLLLALAAGMVLVVLSDALGSALGRPMNEFMVVIARTYRSATLFTLALIVAAPLFEEICFRGFLYEGFERSWLGPVGAIVVTALVWASIHLQYDLFDMGVIFVSGLLLGVVRWRTRSLLPCLALHAAWNAVATAQVILYVKLVAP